MIAKLKFKVNFHQNFCICGKFLVILCAGLCGRVCVMKMFCKLLTYYE